MDQNTRPDSFGSSGQIHRYNQEGERVFINLLIIVHGVTIYGMKSN